MKHYLLPLALLIASAPAFSAIDKKFNEETYEFKSLKVNTSKKEHSMSLYKDNMIIYLQDNTVYAGVVDTSATGLDKVKKQKDLTDLGVRGTVAYDNAKKKIYFTIKEDENCEWLYESTFDGNEWSKPKRLVIEGLGKERGRSYFLANAGWNYAKEPKIIMTNPTIAKKGNRIYFTSADIENGKGGKDIWWIEPKDEKVWKYPVNAGEAVNTDADEDFAFVENDEILYVTSTKDGGNNVYKSEVIGTAWTQREKMDTPYNTDSNSDYNIVVKDGTPFIISDRGGNDDIWAWVQLPKPEPEPEIIIPELEPIVITFPWAFYLFDFDKADLTERFLREIDAMVEAMNQLPAGTKFIIEGHTDQRGTDAYNDKLSLERANTVRDKLIEKGVNPDILVAKGYGKRRPVIANPQNEEEFYQNRRVVVDILKDDAQIEK